MKLDFNFDLVLLNGEFAKDELGANVNVSKMIANTLVNQSKGDALKFWDWAQTLYKGEILDLDSSDQETFKTFIKEGGLPIYAKAQVLHVLKKD
jgi:hypothetical protein